MVQKFFEKTDVYYPKSDKNRYRTFSKCVVVEGRLTPQIDPLESLNTLSIFSTPGWYKIKNWKVYRR